MNLTIFQIIAYSSVGSILLFLIVSLYLFKQTHMNIRKQTFSHLGGIKKTMNKFNFLLFLLGITQITFVLSVAYRFKIYETNLGLLGVMLIGITAFAGIFCSYFSHKRNKKLHVIIGALGFAASGPGWVLLGLSLIKFMGAPAYVLIAIGLMVTIVVFSSFLKTRNLPAVYEMIFFCGILASNFLILLYL